MAGLVLMPTTPAAAVDGWQRTTDVPECSTDNGHAKVCTPDSGGARACFQPDGEWFWLRDRVEDGQPVAISWYYEDPSTFRTGKAYWDDGSAAGWTNLNKSFSEEGHIWFQACKADLEDRTVNSCSIWVDSSTFTT